MNSKIRLGIIGCGRAAELIYLPMLVKNTEMVVTSVVDPIQERREWFAYKIKSSTPAESINENVIQSIDAALISTPPGDHVFLADALLKCNKHVLVEKPLSLNLDNINNLIDTAAKSRAHLLMAFNHRYWEPVMKLKSILNDPGNIQKPTYAEIKFHGNYSLWDPVSFHSDAINDLGPHVFDLIRYLFDQEIYSVSVSSEKENHYTLVIKTSAGIRITAALAHSDKTEKIIRVVTDYNEYYITLGSSRVLPLPGTKRKMLDLKDNIIQKALRRVSPIKNSYEIQLSKFIEMIRTKESVNPDVTDGIAAVKAAMAAHLSLKTKQEVILDEIK